MYEEQEAIEDARKALERWAEPSDPT
jgi:hypothetical protein